MPRHFIFLPYVDDCCNFFPLPAAVNLITCYTAVVSFNAMLQFVTPTCHNASTSSGFGLIVTIFEIMVSCFGLLLLIATFLLGFTISMNIPIVKPFIVLSFVLCFFYLLLALILFVRMHVLEYSCEQHYFGYKRKFQLSPFWLVFDLCCRISVAAMMIYHAIVVNSYAKLWEDHGGHIPQPEVVVIRMPHPGPPYPPGSPSPYPPYAGQPAPYPGQQGTPGQQQTYPPYQQQPPPAPQ